MGDISNLRKCVDCVTYFTSTFSVLRTTLICERSQNTAYRSHLTNIAVYHDNWNTLPRSGIWPFKEGTWHWKWCCKIFV